jgi:hypothetical protein
VARRTSRVVVVPPDIRSDTDYELIARVSDPITRAQALAQYPRPLICRYATPRNVADVA